MEIVTIIRKNYPKLTKVIRVGDLDKSKYSTKFLSHNLSDDVLDVDLWIYLWLKQVIN